MKHDTGRRRASLTHHGHLDRARRNAIEVPQSGRGAVAGHAIGAQTCGQERLLRRDGRASYEVCPRLRPAVFTSTNPTGDLVLAQSVSERPRALDNAIVRLGVGSGAAVCVHGGNQTSAV
jgi:hypothetical protein